MGHVNEWVEGGCYNAYEIPNSTNGINGNTTYHIGGVRDDLQWLRLTHVHLQDTG